MRIVYLDTYISNICLHIVGNKIADEGLLFSILPTELNSNIKKILTIYFINSFTSEEYYQLYHESDLVLNEVIPMYPRFSMSLSNFMNNR